jgi:hypothetical protein
MTLLGYPQWQTTPPEKGTDKMPLPGSHPYSDCERVDCVVINDVDGNTHSIVSPRSDYSIRLLSDLNLLFSFADGRHIECGADDYVIVPRPFGF